jgi:hypothetical protein
MIKQINNSIPYLVIGAVALYLVYAGHPMTALVSVIVTYQYLLRD